MLTKKASTSPLQALISLLLGGLIAAVAGSTMLLAFCLPDHVTLLVRYIFIAIVYNITNLLTIIISSSVIFIDKPTDQGVLTHRQAITLYLSSCWKYFLIMLTLNVVFLIVTWHVSAPEYFGYVALVLMTCFTMSNVFLVACAQTQIFQRIKSTGKKKKAPKKWINMLIGIITITILGIGYASGVEHIKLYVAQSSVYTAWAILGSLCIKFSVNVLLRSLLMGIRMHPHSSFFLFATSTTMIGTPMRLLCNYLLDSGNAVSAVLVLGTIEVLVRLGIICKVSLVAKLKLKRSKDESRMKTFTKWKERRFGLLEAENYAEMLAEYMAICFSICIYAATKREVTFPVIYLGFLQIAVELLVDWFCLRIEQHLGIPIASLLQTTKGYRFVLCTNAVLGITVSAIPMYLATINIFLELKMDNLSVS